MHQWSSFEAALRYYLAEGFSYVESWCWCCGNVQRVLVFPEGPKTIQCLRCHRMTSSITLEIGRNA